MLKLAVENKIPVYFIRTSYNKGWAECCPTTSGSRQSKPPVGEFYPAGDEATILNAIKDIDRRSSGRVEIKRYSSQQPRFTPYAFVAASFWTCALLLRSSRCHIFGSFRRSRSARL